MRTSGVLVLAVILLCGPLAATSQGKETNRNVVLLIADDLGLQLGCYGDRVAKTPNLDALARKGVRFANAFAAVASCSPSRSTIYTGLQTHTSGQYGLAHASHNFHTRPNIKSLPGYLRPAGYRTAIIGKTHIVPASVYDFDEEIRSPGRNGIEMAAKAEKFISSQKDKPFCLILGFTDPHRAAKGFANEGKHSGIKPMPFSPTEVPVPAHLPDTATVRADLADYYQSVNRLDQGVGAILETLKKTNHENDTLVIFLSDNGIPFPGAKTTLYDAGIHLPLILFSPNLKKSLVNEAMVSWIDVLPTILDWSGVKTPASLQGRSMLKILDQEKPKGWDEIYVSHTFHEVTMYYPMRAIRTRQYKYIRNLAHKLDFPFASDLYNSPSWQSILSGKLERMGSLTVKQFMNRPAEELFDITSDPAETKNLADNPNQGKVLADLRARVKAWQAKTKDPWVVKDIYE